MAWILYQLAMGLLLLLAAPFLLARKGRHYLETWSGRWGRYDPARGEPVAGETRRRLWIHAISVGEVAVAATLARALPEETPLVVTTVTPTGQKRARAAFDGENAAVTYLPFDFAFVLRRFFARFAPRALVLVEGDYWPLVMRFVRRHQLPAVVVNGRLSERSFHRLRLLGSLPRRLLYAGVGHFGVQTADDRERLLALGVEPERVTVTGNLKYDTPEPPSLPELEETLRRVAAGRPILVAGSTMRGEEESVLDAFAKLGAERALLLLVPRHPERWDGVARLVEERGFTLLRRSALGDAGSNAGSDAGSNAGSNGRVDVVLLDSLGELAALYRVAALAFIGGTLVPTGGHNPLEPARFAVPIVVGSSMDNFREMAADFDEARAWYRVRDAHALAVTWQNGLDAPEEAAAVGRRGAELLARNRGALERTRKLLEPLLAALAENP